MADPARFELATFGMPYRRASQLRHGPMCPWEDSNFQRFVRNELFYPVKLQGRLSKMLTVLNGKNNLGKQKLLLIKSFCKWARGETLL